MESITIKVDKSLAKEMEKAMKPLYSTKTEFIREAIRDKVKDESKERLLAAFRKFHGAAKVKVSDEELRKARRIAGKILVKKYGFES